jgi:hypothetical protein
MALKILDILLCIIIFNFSVVVIVERDVRDILLN